MKLWRLLVVLVLLGVAAKCAAQTAPAADSSAVVWKAMWQPAFDASKSASVKDLTLERDRIRLTLADGTLQFTQPVNGLVFGATFRGRGRLQVSVPNRIEGEQLHLFTKQDGLDMEFTEATFCFTDNTFNEVAAKVQWAASGPTADDLYTSRQQQREDLGAELLPRLFKSVLSTDRKPTALFAADLKTKDRGWTQVRFDALEPEEITVGRWADVGIRKHFDIWLSFPAGGRGAAEAWHDPLAREDFNIRSYVINATVTGGAELAATTRVTLEPRLSGERVLLFFLDSNLRVDSVKDAQGHALAFYQARESKDRVQSYGEYVAVALPELTKAGQSQTLEFRYAGKRVVRKVGAGNYFCESFGWYPARENSFASRADFEINFRSPKKYTLVATGNKVSETTDGDWLITSWKSDPPLAVAGFAFGDYKVYNEKAGTVDIDIYANRQPDDFMHSIEQVTEGSLPGESTFGMPAMGSLSPSVMAKTMGIEVANTVRLFELYFGPYPYKHLAVTNIPYSYGQGWPGLLYLSALSFLDSTQRHNLGIRDNIRLTDFFRAHESSHQWWGHRVGWKSYHDQWLSEGFAEFSGYLYILYRQNQKEYLNRLRLARQDLAARDLHNHVYESVGPVWMGRRLSSSESPRGYATVIYVKGGYILHMLRMMLYDPRNQEHDQLFQTMMRDFCKTYDNKAASTEDFKAIVEKYMTRAMDLEGNHRMDWFFRQYVYGTGVPHYEFRYQTQNTPEGKVKILGKVTRSGVPDDWMDTLPLYLHKGGGAMRIGFVNATKPETPFEFLMSSQPEKLSLNYNEDVLAEIKQ
ncbi:MAG: hypothetical protein DMG29_16885 [Acidobacteria bacterium]|nr:MAG: hypothetical protein DMG29_16885 [Acidobacteriota bacterium]